MSKKYESVVITCIEAICIILLIVHFGLIFNMYDLLPDKIITHYNIKGIPDGYGDKSSILMLPGISLVMYVVMTLLSRWPEKLNYPVPLTEENKPQLFRYTLWILRYSKLIMLLMFFCISLQALYHLPLGGAFVCVTIVLLIGPPFYGIYKMISIGSHNKGANTN
jgi:uncharacterized membrane protein